MLASLCATALLMVAKASPHPVPPLPSDPPGATKYSVAQAVPVNITNADTAAAATLFHRSLIRSNISYLPVILPTVPNSAKVDRGLRTRSSKASASCEQYRTSCAPVSGEAHHLHDAVRRPASTFHVAKVHPRVIRLQSVVPLPILDATYLKRNIDPDGVAS